MPRLEKHGLGHAPRELLLVAQRLRRGRLLGSKSLFKRLRRSRRVRLRRVRLLLRARARVALLRA